MTVNFYHLFESIVIVNISCFDYLPWNYCANSNQTMYESYCEILRLDLAKAWPLKAILVSDWIEIEKSSSLKLHVQMIC